METAAPQNPDAHTARSPFGFGTRTLVWQSGPNSGWIHSPKAEPLAFNLRAQDYRTASLGGVDTDLSSNHGIKVAGLYFIVKQSM
jgi:hypothetical protein